MFDDCAGSPGPVHHGTWGTLVSHDRSPCGHVHAFSPASTWTFVEKILWTAALAAGMPCMPISATLSLYVLLLNAAPLPERVPIKVEWMRNGAGARKGPFVMAKNWPWLSSADFFCISCKADAKEASLTFA